MVETQWIFIILGKTGFVASLGGLMALFETFVLPTF
jgi:hypothetical protein